MVAAGEGGRCWDEQTLTQFLVKPRDFVKGTRMAFAGLRKSADVANVIEYLKTFDSGDGLDRWSGGKATWRGNVRWQWPRDAAAAAE
jgi:hypothetical protein